MLVIRLYSVVEDFSTLIKLLLEAHLDVHKASLQLLEFILRGGFAILLLVATLIFVPTLDLATHLLAIRLERLDLFDAVVLSFSGCLF